MAPVGEGREIRALRTRRGWTQVQLARALGTDPVTVSRWERGISRPRPGARLRLATLGLEPPSLRAPRFSEDPAARLRKIDRARREQLALRNRARRRT